MDSRSLLLLALVIVPAFSVQSTCTNQNPCLISCEGCTGITMIYDPTNCHRFYYCNEDKLVTDTPFDCPSGEEFNPETHKCELDWDDNGCEPLCHLPPKECHYTCQAGDPVISSMYDCSTYYTCDAAGNQGSAKTCPAEKPFFDGNKCQSNDTVCCHCHGYCFPGDEGRLVVDPVDCRKYYLCLTEGLPAQSGTCDSGEHFDPISQKCSLEAPCRTMCRNVVGADGCIENFTCDVRGNFAKCPGKCSPEYYECSYFSDTYIEAKSCYGNEVFDDDRCVRPDQCQAN